MPINVIVLLKGGKIQKWQLIQSQEAEFARYARTFNGQGNDFAGL